MLEYENKAELKVTACGTCHTIYSNEVEAKKIEVKVRLEESKPCVFEGEQLEYIVKICNESCIDLKDVIFFDDLPRGLEYVPCSFKVNGEPKTPMLQPCSNNISYCLRELEAKEEVCITFCTKVL